MKVLAIEGNRQRLDGGAMFGNAPRELWKQWTTPNEKNQIELACRSLLLLDFHGKNLLFDVGIGACFPPKLQERYGVEGNTHLLLQRLKKEGISEEQIDGVILSHLHFDHAGGLLPAYGEERNTLHFPNATYYVGKNHWERAQNPHPRERASFLPELHEKLESSGRLSLINHPSHPDLPGITFRFSDGHTIGLMVSEIALPDQLLVFGSDLIAGLPWVHLPITMGYDRFPEKTVDEKKEALASYLKSRATLFFVHDPSTAFAQIEQDEKGRYRGRPD